VVSDGTIRKSMVVSALHCDHSNRSLRLYVSDAQINGWVNLRQNLGKKGLTPM